MAKQVLDLYELYRLVVQHGGLVEIINKKLWREITKGLNLPSSITSAAFTLRTQLVFGFVSTVLISFSIISAMCYY
ncbi:unnamed protein product [Anisakis simplex]|uniref:Protein dead ringer (inferred by orthology to a D. melanogaster protein) n=1 Tax=Anisakis simplex TaxID=6269 RepID=A0A0M3J4N8_ANISI|nr:unnamed protein product [Anisakis simplex]